MSVFEITLVISTLLCSLVAGFLFAYAIVVMPGIKSLGDRQFIRAFQVTDRVIQNNHPLFLLVWVGSAIAILICAFHGYGELEGMDVFLLLLAAFGYLAGVQALTVIVNLPLNNQLQKLETDTMNQDDLKKARDGFEPRWNKSNEIRTAVACCVSLLLTVLVFRQ